MTFEQWLAERGLIFPGAGDPERSMFVLLADFIEF